MAARELMFYLLAAIVLLGAFLAVTGRKILRAAVFLLLSLAAIAGIYFYLGYEFLGAVQIVVYVGGIVVLIIFSIFLTHESGSDMPTPASGRIITSVLACSTGLVFTCLFIREQVFVGNTGGVLAPTVRNLGRQMLSTTAHGYLLPFEVVSMLLLAAMIGCIVIALKSRKTT